MATKQPVLQNGRACAMRRAENKQLIPAALFLLGSVTSGLVPSGSAHAQQARRNRPATIRPEVAPRLPAPAVALDASPREFLLAARSALVRGRVGEAAEALERAETRLLDRAVMIQQAGLPASDRIVLDLAVARRAAARQVPVATRAIDDALRLLGDSLPPPTALSFDEPTPTQLAAPIQTLQPVVPTTTYALLPGHWQLNGATHQWVPPDTVLRPVQDRSVVPGRYEWKSDAWVWAPTHSGE